MKDTPFLISGCLPATTRSPACRLVNLAGSFSQRGQNSGEADRGVDEGLAQAPGHGVGRHHAEATVLVDKGDGSGGEEAQRAGNDGTHQQDHNAVEFPQLVPPQHTEGDDGGDAV